MLHVAPPGISVHPRDNLPRARSPNAHESADEVVNETLIHLVGSHVRFLISISLAPVSIKE